ncbi:GTP-sensing pleiotropic transcriptional regulator CodY [Lipingzhangella halophila]|uniref:GTP-sensing pleiotropic transcriptional regulator CodY n=1 Tax=Lipingzhangella halophila TaxID=1783352 RepID=A0A7W7RM90_9ACTN|nr:hypothetical protein [Lipingzhangella halophila]MBB4934593.1 GTP-sensing pleiotropic transcriptional regulator CodY [Lipingzhangella halophila]
MNEPLDDFHHYTQASLKFLAALGDAPVTPDQLIATAQVYAALSNASVNAELLRIKLEEKDNGDDEPTGATLTLENLSSQELKRLEKVQQELEQERDRESSNG